MLPILNLPWIPLEQIIKRIPPFELLNFSLLSNRCTTAAKRAKCKVDEVEWYLNKWNAEITIRRSSASKITILMYENPRNPRITKFCVKNELEKYSDIWIVSESATVLDTLEKLSAHVLKIFNAKELNLHSWDAQPPLPNFWHKLNLSFDSFNYDFRSGCLVDSDSMMFLLDNIKTDKLMLLNLQVVSEFQYSTPLKFNGLYIRNAHWFTLDNLLSMECIYLIIFGSHITASDLNVFSKKWQQGLFPKLRHMCFSKPRQVNWTLRIENADGNGRLTDVHGNRGRFEERANDEIKFRVKSKSRLVPE